MKVRLDTLVYLFVDGVVVDGGLILLSQVGNLADNLFDIVHGLTNGFLVRGHLNLLHVALQLLLQVLGIKLTGLDGRRLLGGILPSLGKTDLHGAILLTEAAILFLLSRGQGLESPL